MNYVAMSLVIAYHQWKYAAVQNELQTQLWTAEAELKKNIYLLKLGLRALTSTNKPRRKIKKKNLFRCVGAYKPRHP